MDILALNFLKFFWWLRNFIYLWVRSRATPKEGKERLGLDLTRPVVYVLKTRSFKDLLVLDKHCEEWQLPLPRAHYTQELDLSGIGSAFHLAKTGLLQENREKEIPQPLNYFLDKVRATKQDIQLVPVSVFWGRNPGKEEKSLFKILFFDDEYGGWLQRFITFFVQGRNVFIHFGQPISLLSQIGQEPLETTAKKMRRILRIHFRNQREIALGPYLYDRNRLIDNLLYSKSVQQAIAKEVEKSGLSKEKVLQTARGYANELAADLSPKVIRFLDVLLTWVFSRIFNGVVIKNQTRIENMAREYELVYLPCHRSHIDYLLLNYVVFSLGITPPHTVAGINLNFWPVGPILRRAGAVFIRRSFNANRLYSEVVRTYLNILMRSHYGICFFPEGGRSRTGKLLQPKLGILSMLVKAKLDKASKPLMFVPVYIGYDRVVEAASYIKELGGSSKKTESFRQLFSSLSFLRKNFGHAYVAFGEGIIIDTRQFMENTAESNLNPHVASLAHQLAVNTNDAAIISSTALFSSIVLATPRCAIAETSLVQAAQTFVTMLKEVYPNILFGFNEKAIKDELSIASELCAFERVKYQGGDLVALGEKERILATYYSNNIIHLFALHSLLASFFKEEQSFEKQDLLLRAQILYPYLKAQYFLKVDLEHIQETLEQTLDSMVLAKLLVQEGSFIKRPTAFSENLTYLRILGNMLGSTFESWALCLALLASFSEEEIAVKAFYQRSEIIMRERLVLGDGPQQILIQPKKTEEFLHELEKEKLIWPEGAGKLKVSLAVHEIARRLSVLLQIDLRNELLGPKKVENGQV